ncbi:MAG: serine hydrolase domain-containing protein [Wenzhouxiangellaceae bacterium]|nr:serine hydrolase domain-containing protein [Wenzhouxiangellaceae bacterium]
MSAAGMAWMAGFCSFSLQASKRLRGFGSTLLLICTGLLSGTAMAQAPDYAGIAQDFDERFAQEISQEQIPGGVYAIVHAGQILRLGSMGRVALNQDSRAVDASTAFRIASLSKGFSGVLAAMLASENQFLLDAPVSSFAPGFTLKPAMRPLTVEDVLGQRSGYIPNAFDNLIEAGLGRAEIIPRLSALEPICPPGKCYSYQNNAFSLIEDVIEQSVGRPFSQVLRERLFEPLGMAGAAIGSQSFLSLENRAEPHLKTSAGWLRIKPRTTYYQVQSAAGINAGSLDMAQWAIAMLGHRPDVISAEVIAEVLTPRIHTRRDLRNRNWRDVLVEAHYGLGWRIYQLEQHRLALHGGWVAGYRAEIALSHELDLGLVILMNAESRAVGRLNRFFWDLAFATGVDSDRPR